MVPRRYNSVISVVTARVVRMQPTLVLVVMDNPSLPPVRTVCIPTSGTSTTPVASLKKWTVMDTALALVKWPWSTPTTFPSAAWCLSMYAMLVSVIGLAH